MNTLHNVPLVSVIMPAYNAAEFLTFSIGSVINQTYPNIEIIVIDDDSTDDTKSVIAALQDKHASLRYIWQENGKQGKARNRGIHEAKGEYVAFLDADDEWVPNKIEYQVKQINQHKADLVFSDGMLVKTSEKEALSKLLALGAETIKMGAFCGELYENRGKSLLYRKNRIPTSSVLCRKDSLISAGSFIEEEIFQNCEDYHLWIRMVEKGCKLIGFNDLFLLYRMHPGSSTISPLSSYRPLINMLFIIQKPLPHDVRIQLAGHIIGFLGVVEHNPLSKADVAIFKKYNEHSVGWLWRIILKLVFILEIRPFYFKLLRKNAANWVAKDISDDLR